MGVLLAAAAKWRHLALISGLTIMLSSVLAVPARAAPSNDMFLAAVPFTTPVSFTGDNVGATTELGEQQPCGFIGSTVWYKFTPPTSGWIGITTLGPSTSFDTVLALYEGGPSILALLSRRCNDDVGFSLRSYIRELLVGGRTYYVQLGGYTGGQGTFHLQINFEQVGGRPCGIGKFGALTCVGPSIGSTSHTPYSGAFAQWPSVSLNITQDAARSGGWIAEAIWLYNTWSSLSNPNWLELGDTAGTVDLRDVPSGPNAWERWWYWVDGNTAGPNTYAEWGIQPSPNDGVTRSWGFQWDGVADGGWGLYRGENGVFTRVASRQWIDPAVMTDQLVTVGSEIEARVFNSNGNSGLFQVSAMQVRDPIVAWHVWPFAAWQAPNSCATDPAPFCVTGSYLSGPPPYDNWRVSKPQ